MMVEVTSPVDARRLIAEGCLLAYPTEAVYGLGCDPFNQTAVDKLLTVKQRSVSKGLILLIYDWEQLMSLISAVPVARLDVVRATWPGPTTWVFPKSNRIPVWISGVHDSVAIRMTAHSVARSLCLDGPLVSTSANITGNPSIMDSHQLKTVFPQGIDGFVTGALGTALQPSVMIDVLSGAQLRP